MDGMVLIGHGRVPEAIKEAVCMIAGSATDIRTVCLLPEEGNDDLTQQLDELLPWIASKTHVLVCADLLGGSPCNAAYARLQTCDNVSMVAGINLPLVLTAALEDDHVDALIAAGRNGICDVKKTAEAVEQNRVVQTAPEPSALQGPRELVGVRIDARGIHGQVATAWVPAWKANRIVVIDDEAVGDATQKMALKMAKPASVKLSILSTTKAAERLQDDQAYAGERVMVVMLKAKTVEELYNKGLKFDSVVVGNIPSRDKTTSFAKCVHLTQEEEDSLRRMAQAGTALLVQQVPTDHRVELFTP